MNEITTIPQGSPAPGEAPPSNVTALAVQRRPEQREAREVRVVNDPIPVLDTARFEHMQRIAAAMATGSLIPDCLCRAKDGDKTIELPMNVVVSNCFLVVNQAVRWGMDPFAVAQCVSVVHGKLCYEGKLVHAVIESRLGVRLNYQFVEAKGQDFGVIVSGTIPGEDKPREIDGKVKDWHKGSKSPWADEGAWKRQLRYRGAREWARAHAPSVMLGVYADDEFDERPRSAPAPRDITPKAPVRTAIPDLTAEVPERAHSAPKPAASAPQVPARDHAGIPDLEVVTAAEPPLADEAGFLDKLREDRGFCSSETDLAELRDGNADMRARLSPAGQAEFDRILSVEE